MRTLLCGCLYIALLLAALVIQIVVGLNWWVVECLWLALLISPICMDRSHRGT